MPCLNEVPAPLYTSQSKLWLTAGSNFQRLQASVSTTHGAPTRSSNGPLKLLQAPLTDGR
eukprot:1483358-Pleurochrysis_carterae.AAC.4